MDKYEKVRVLGKGSFGSAILIKRKTDDALFVVKEIPLGHLNRKERAEARKECSVLQRLQHPNIVQYIEHFENNSCLYLVMEYCDDSDLSKKVKECQGPMKESCILYYFSQVCLAVKYLHSKHILHRDLKTMNVFLMRNGTVKIGDFGIAIMLRNTLAVAKTVCGTPYYFSPELCRNRPYNSKSDMWSLGILLYECATGGRHPFDGSNMSQLMHRIVKTPHKPISDSCYSLELRNLVDWCLHKQPTKRPSILQVLAYPLVWKSMVSLEEKLLFATSHQLGLQDLLDDTGSSYDITSSHLWLPPPPTLSDAKSDSMNAPGEVKNREVRMLHPKSVKDVGADLASLPALSIASGVPIPSTLPVVSIPSTASPISNDGSEVSKCSSPVLFRTSVCDTEESHMTEMKAAEVAIQRPSSFASDRSKTGNFGPASQTAKPSETNLSSEAPIKKEEKRMSSDQVSPFIHTTDKEVVISDDGSKGRGHDEQELEGGYRLPSASLSREGMEVASEVRKKESNTDAYQVQSKQKPPEEVVHCESDALQKTNDKVEEKERLTFLIRGEKALVMKNIQAKVMCLQELQKNMSRAQKVRKRITGKAWRPHPERKKALISHIQSNPPSIPSGVSPCCSLKVDAACGPPLPRRFHSMSKGVVASSLPCHPPFIHDTSSRTNPCNGFHKNSPLFQVEKKKMEELRREGRQSTVPMTGVPAQSARIPAGASHSINSAGRRIKWNHSKKAKQAYRSPYAQPFRNPCKDMVGRNAAVSEGRVYACRNREADLLKVLPSSVSHLPIHSRSSFSSSSSLALSTSTFSSRPPFKAIDAPHSTPFCAPNDTTHLSSLSPLPPRHRWRELPQSASSSSSLIESSKSTSQMLRKRSAAKEESEWEQKERHISPPPLVETTEHTSTPGRKGGSGRSEQRKGMIHRPSRAQSIRVRDSSVTKPISSVLSSSFIFRPSPTTYASFPNDHPSTSSLCPITASAVGLGKGILAHSLAILEEENKSVQVDESHRSSSAVLSHFSTGTSSMPLTSGHARGTAPTRIRTPPPPLCCPSLPPPSPLSSSHPLRAVPIHEGPPSEDAFLPASSSRYFTCPSPARVLRSPSSVSPSTPFSSQRVLESIQSSRHPRWPLSQASHRPPLPPELTLRPCLLPQQPLSTPQQRPPSPSQQAVVLSPIPSSSPPCTAILDALKSVVPSSDSLLPDEVLQRDKKTFSVSCETFPHDGSPPPAQEDRLRPLPFSLMDPSLLFRRGSPPAPYVKGTMERDRWNLRSSLQGKPTMTNVSLSSSQWMDSPTTLETALVLQEKKKTRTKMKKKIRKGKGLVGVEEADSSQWKAKENTVLRVTAPPLPSPISSPSLALSQGAIEGGGGSHFALPSPLHTLSSPSSSHVVECTSQVECSIDHPTDERDTKKTVTRGMKDEHRGEVGPSAFHTLDKSRSIPSVEAFHPIDLPSSLTEQKNVESGACSYQKNKQKKKLRDKPMKCPLRHCDFNRHRCEAKQTESVPYLEQPREKENVGKNNEEIANEVDAELLDVGDVLTYPSPMDKKCICGGEERKGESLDGNGSRACRRHSGQKNSLRQGEWRQWSSTFFTASPTSSDPAAFFRTTSTVATPLPSWEKSSEIHLHHVPPVVEEDEENCPTTTTTNAFSLHIPVTVQDAVHHAKGLLFPRHRFIRSTDLYAGMSRAVPSLAEERYLAEQKKRGAMEQEKLVKDKSEEGEENDSSPNALAFPSVLESLRGTREVSTIKRSLSLSPSLNLLKHRHDCGDIRIHRKSSTSDAITTPRETSSPSIRSAASVSATPSFHSRASSKSSANRKQTKRVSSTLFRAKTLPTVLSMPSRYVNAPPPPVRPLSLSLNAQCISETTFTSTQESLAEKMISKTEASNPHSVCSLTPSKEYSKMLRFLKKRLYRRKPRVLGSPGLNDPRKKGA